MIQITPRKVMTQEYKYKLGKFLTHLLVTPTFKLIENIQKILLLEKVELLEECWKQDYIEFLERCWNQDHKVIKDNKN